MEDENIKALAELEFNANTSNGTSNLGQFKFPEMQAQSANQWAHDEVQLRGRTWGLSEAFNNNASPNGPRDFGYFVDGPATVEKQGHNSHQLTTILHGPDNSARIQSLYFKEQDGEVTSVAIGNFNLEANGPIENLFGLTGGGYTYMSRGGPLMDNDENGELAVAAPSSEFYIPQETPSQYLQNIIEQDSTGHFASQNHGSPAHVRVALSNDDPERHPKIVIGEMMKDYLDGYMRQNPAEAQQVIDNLPAGLLEQFGLEVTADGITNNFITENDLSKPQEPTISLPEPTLIIDAQSLQAPAR